MTKRIAHLAGVLLLLVAVGTAGWVAWPLLTDRASESSDREQQSSPEERPARIEGVVARRFDFAVRTRASGHLAPWRRAQVSPRASGRVVAVSVEEGDRVAAGDLLFRLDESEARIQLREARAALLAAQAQYASEVGLGTSAGGGDPSSSSRAEDRYLAVRDSFRTGEISLERLREARDELESAGLLQGASQSQVRAARTGLLQAEQQVVLARLQLDRRRIMAPFSGRVANLEAEVGSQVSAGETQLVLIEDRRMKVRTEVLESDVARVKEGASAIVRVPALGDSLISGTVHAINPLVDPALGTGRVTVRVSNPAGELIYGLYAEVQVETRRLRDQLVVPEDAILLRQGRELVFVVEDGRAQWTYVQTGARSSGYAVIGEGVTQGDTVAVGGHFALAHDADVTVEVTDAAYGTLNGTDELGLARRREESP